MSDKVNLVEKSKAKWIDELIAKRRTMQSPMVVVETDDIRRYRQLVHQRPNIAPNAHGERWIVLETWTWKGLNEIKVDKSSIGKTGGREITYEEMEPMNCVAVCPMKQSEKNAYCNVYCNILSKAIDELSKQPTVLVIKSLLKVDDYLANVLFSVATDLRLLYRGSTIVLFLGNRNILPKAIRKHVVIVTPPKSTAEERTMEIKNAILIGILELDEKEIPAVVRALAGLNLDQIDMFLTEAGMELLHNRKIDRNLLMKKLKKIER